MEETRTTYMAYEYKEIDVLAEQFSFLVDSYGCFGWRLDENISGEKDHNIYAKRLAEGRSVKLRLKRERKIMNKAELTRLQRNFEACRNEVEELERSKTSGPSVWALTVGIIGTAFMAGSVFAVVATPPQVLLCIILAVPAFIGWIMPYFMYKKMVANKTKRINPMIDSKYEEMYELCEKGNKLLY